MLEFDKKATGQVLKENAVMSSPAIATVIKMMESLPEDVQDRVISCPDK
jgi:hypothetical protein